jgi:hypothetical protein
MMVLWEGTSRRERTEIDALDVDANKDDLELELEPYEDGRPAPVLQQARAARPARGGPPAFDDSSEDEDDGEAGGEEDEDEAPDEVVYDDITWTKRDPTYIKNDFRTAARSQTTLNKGDINTNSIDKLFDCLMSGNPLQHSSSSTPTRSSWAARASTRSSTSAS